jgi:hypothetical protein
MTSSIILQGVQMRWKYVSSGNTVDSSTAVTAYLPLLEVIHAVSRHVISMVVTEGCTRSYHFALRFEFVIFGMM